MKKLLILTVAALFAACGNAENDNFIADTYSYVLNDVPNRVVAIGKSSQGITDTNMGTLPIGTYSKVVYGNGKWIATGVTSAMPVGYIFYSAISADGKNWSPLNVLPGTVGDSNYALRGGGGLAAYGAGKWLIVGGGRSVSSTDGGVSWGPVEDAPKKLIQLAFVDNKFIAVCKEDSGDLIYTSSNGSAWSSVSVSVKFSFCNIAFGASKTIIAGYAQPVGGSALSGYYLTNSGSGWTSTPASPFLPRSIVFGNSNFVSADNYYISSSTDGSSWNGPVSPGLSVIIKDIVFFNGYFNLFGQDIYNTTKIYKSSTGAAPWSTPATLPAGEWSAFAVAP